MASILIGSSLNDRSSSPVRSKVKCCRLRDHFSCRVTNCSATKIPSASITDHHQRSAGGLVAWPYSSAVMQSAYSTTPAERTAEIFVTGWKALIVQWLYSWDTMTQIVDEVFYISLRINILEKDINPTIPPEVGQTVLLSLVLQQLWENEISLFKPVKLSFSIYLELLPARAEGFM